jgi:hypothetical protein
MDCSNAVRRSALAGASLYSRILPSVERAVVVRVEGGERKAVAARSGLLRREEWRRERRKDVMMTLLEGMKGGSFLFMDAVDAGCR